ncbi:hypothetical protein Lal_00037393 [Lupinus albus]|nr:hypothetical protein Lal_00037393 [Lupinus albus]
MFCLHFDFVVIVSSGVVPFSEFLSLNSKVMADQRRKYSGRRLLYRIWRRKEFKDICVVFELMESDLHQVIKANDDLTPEANADYKLFRFSMLCRAILEETQVVKIRAEDDGTTFITLK